MDPLLIIQGFVFEPIPETLDDWVDMLEIDIMRSWARDWRDQANELRKRLFATSFESN